MSYIIYRVFWNSSVSQMSSDATVSYLRNMIFSVLTNDFLLIKFWIKLNVYSIKMITNPPNLINRFLNKVCDKSIFDAIRCFRI